MFRLFRKRQVISIFKTHSSYQISGWLPLRERTSKLNINSLITIFNKYTSNFSVIKTHTGVVVSEQSRRVLTTARLSFLFIFEGVIVVLLFFVSVHFLRVPIPHKEQIEAIIGKDPALEDTISENEIIKTIAHRGAGLDAPENSLIAFKMCNDKGVNFVEFDITLTKDNVPVIFHDNTLERMTDCCDLIRDKTYAELKEIDISVKHPFKDRYKGTIIPTLDETIKQLLNSEQNMFIDIKDNNMQLGEVSYSFYVTYIWKLSK